MPRSQIVLSIIVILLILGMYQLPKVVLNDQEASLNTSSQAQSAESQATDLHAAPLPPVLQDKVKALKKAFDLEENKEKKTIFADSIARVLRAANHLDSALFYYEYIVKAKPKDTQAQLDLADAFYDAYNFYGIINATQANKYGADAEKLYRQVLRENPDNLNIEAKIATLHVSNSKNPMKGILELRGVLEKDPENEIALMSLGLFSIQSGQFDKALDRFKTLIAAHPENGEAKIFLGQTYANLGDKEAAKKVFQEIVDTEPDSLVQAAAQDYLLQLK